MSSDMLSICGLWSRKDKNGLEYLTGRLTRTTRLMVFNNQKKEGENDPEYYLCVCRNESQDLKPGEIVKQKEGHDDIPF